MSEDKSKFTKKVSPLIEGQVPDFVQADHPVFVDFVKDYFQFLEAGRLTVTLTINYIVQETASTSYILDETDGERIVTEIGEGTLGQFVEGETITGGTSNATATVLVDDTRNKYIYVTSQQKFVTGEVITGATSGATGTPQTTGSETVTLANNNTVIFTSGYANPELEPDSGDIIYIENRKPIQRASDQTEDIKLIIEF